MPVEVEAHTVPHFKASINGEIHHWGPESVGTFILVYSLVNIGHLLHKSRPVPFVFSSTVLFTLYNQRYILYKWSSKIYLWLYRVINEFWSNLNFSRVVWDINNKFSQVNVLISYQLSTNFDIKSYIQNGFPAKTILCFSRAWQAYFLSHSHQTPQIC